MTKHTPTKALCAKPPRVLLDTPPMILLNVLLELIQRESRIDDWIARPLPREPVKGGRTFTRETAKVRQRAQMRVYNRNYPRPAPINFMTPRAA